MQLHRSPPDLDGLVTQPTREEPILLSEETFMIRKTPVRKMERKGSSYAVRGPGYYVGESDPLEIEVALRELQPRLPRPRGSSASRRRSAK